MATVLGGSRSPEATDSDLNEISRACRKIDPLRPISRRRFAFVEPSPEAAVGGIEGLWT